MRLNLPVLRGFRQVVVATNYADPGLRAANARMWHTHFPGCILLDSPHNRGHSIGTADLENMLFDYCRRAGWRWLCKSANDVLLTLAVREIPVTDAQFFYINAVSASAVRQHGRDAFGGGFLFPQTTFFVIDTDVTDYLYDTAMLDHSWQTVQGIPGYNDRIWEHLPGWSCERWMRETVLRNDLSRCHLLTDQQWRGVVDLVLEREIEDCSFKGILLNGVCHLPHD